MKTLPYGSWPSPISAADLTTAVVGLERGAVDGDRVYWTQAHPEQGGRIGLWRQDGDSEPVEVTPDHNVRTAVNEYGGGAWSVASGIVVYSNHPTGELWVVEDGARRLLAPGDGLRYGALVVDPVRRVVLAVREDHRESDAACVQTLVALDLDTGNPHVRTLAEGADFYASPALRPDGMVAWVQWQLPKMPWDATELWTAPLDRPAEAVRVAGGPGVSLLHPSWTDDGALVYLSDESGYWNFHRRDGGRSTALHDAPYDFCGPMWVLEPAPYSLLPDGAIACTWLLDGLAHLGILTPAGSAYDPGPVLTEIPTAAVTCAITGRGSTVVALLGFPDRPAELRLLDVTTGDSRLLRRAVDRSDPYGPVSRARPLTWESPDGPVHAWYYPPASADCAAPAGELPPVQVWSHGGPTGFSAPEFRLATQFWTSRGIGILDVNYSGSAGYGRSYRERLNGNWGVSDVRDCVAGAKALVAAGQADPARLSIRGGSAGGFTTLAALTTTDVFAAGISLYGVGDLEALATDTHKFESRYLDGLIAPYPEGRDVYRARSPIHHLDRLNTAMLILQGNEDTVVPPSQAESMAAAVAAKGLPVRLVRFDGEGHGFRKRETIIAVAEEALAFLAQVHGFALPPP